MSRILTALGRYRIFPRLLAWSRLIVSTRGNDSDDETAEEPTGKASGLEPYQYLRDLFTEPPLADSDQAIAALLVALASDFRVGSQGDIL